MPSAPCPKPAAARPVRFLAGTAAGLTSIAALVAAGLPSSPRHAGSNIPGAEFRAVTALSPTNAWAVGDVISAKVALATLVAHWDGRRWVRVPSPSPGVADSGSTLAGVSGASASDVWAVGSYETRSKAFKNLVLHWDGTRWARVPAPSTGFGTLYGTAGVSASDAWAAGYGNGSLILRWNGTRWTQT